VHRKLLAGLLGDSHHLQKLLGVHGHRLFADDVLAGAHGGNRILRVKIVRRGHQHDVDGGIA